jgi:uncharacterized protein (TIGR03067 family)
MQRAGLALFACLLTGCAPGYASDEGDDRQAWQGTWTLVSCVANGKPRKEDVQWIVDGDRYNIRHNGTTYKVPYKFKLDPKTKHVDVFHHETPKGTFGGKYKGLYEVRGDTLTVCLDPKGQRYPRSLDAPRGSGLVIYEFRRARRD